MAESETGSPMDRLSARIAARTTSADTQNADKSVFQTFAKGTEGDPTPPEPRLLDRLAERIGQRDEESAPGTVEGYQIDVEGADQKLVDWFKQSALEGGLTRKQVANLSQKYQAMLVEHAETQRKAAEETSKLITTELQTAWGTEFEANSKAVQEFTKGLSDAQFTALVHRLLHQ